MSWLKEFLPDRTDCLYCLSEMAQKECWATRIPEPALSGLNFNTHSNAHLFRAAQEGIAFSFRYGLDIMKETGINPEIIRAGEANMFLSRIFRETLSGITGTEIHLYNTDGSIGAARGAGIGCGYYKSEKEAFTGSCYSRDY